MMEKPHKCYIKFDNEQDIYLSGDCVSGKIILKLRKKLKINGISLRVQGIASVEWTDTFKGSRVIRKDKNVHFTQSKVLYEGKTIELNCGKNEYPFSVILSKDLPSSFHALYCHIGYKCSLKIFRPGLNNIKYERKFSVGRKWNEMDREDLFPFTLNDYREIKSVIRQPGPISVTCRMNKLYFFHGDTIRLETEILNHSSVKIKKFLITLYSDINSTTTAYYKKSQKIVLREITHGKIISQNGSRFIDEFDIDSMAPSTLTNCKLISVNSILKLTLFPRGITLRNLEFFISITIGPSPP